MAGDGFDMAFLAKYITDIGFSPVQSSFVFTVYGFTAALAAWASGVVAEIITPQKAMKIGFILWLVMHVLFILFGLNAKNYPLILLFYGIRGLAYPLFIYSIIIMIIQTVPPAGLSAATGWFLAMYSVGIGVIDSYFPSLTIPFAGEIGTLWFSVIWVMCGGVLAWFSLSGIKTDISKSMLSKKQKLAELSKAITILYTNKYILTASLIRIINTLAVFGFAVVMPLFFTRQPGFTISEWLQIWAVFFFITVFSNIFWGVMGNVIGWLRQVRWFGCLGMAISCLLFYYMPLYYGHNFLAALVPAIFLGIFVCAFVPMTTAFPALVYKNKGAAISIYNLSAGLSNFVAPAITTIILPLFNIVGVVWVYTGLYIFAGILIYFIKIKKPIPI